MRHLFEPSPREGGKQPIATVGDRALAHQDLASIPQGLGDLLNIRFLPKTAYGEAPPDVLPYLDCSLIDKDDTLPILLLILLRPCNPLRPTRLVNERG